MINTINLKFRWSKKPQSNFDSFYEKGIVYPAILDRTDQ